VRELTKHLPRILYYDTLGRDYRDGVVCETLAELKVFWLKVYRGNFRIVYRPADPQADVAAVCRLVRAAGDMMFVVEETDLYFKQGDACPEFKMLIQRGRHAGVDMICVTQRPKGFGRLLTSQTDDFHLFATREPDDLAYFRARCGDAVAERLPNLGLYESYYYNDYETSGNADAD